MSQINVRFREGVDLTVGAVAVRALHGVTQFRQVFPGDSDPELVRMFVADVHDESSERVLTALLASKMVEEAELAPPRRVVPR